MANVHGKTVTGAARGMGLVSADASYCTSAELAIDGGLLCWI